MQKFMWLIGVAGALSLATVASATTCASDTWCFGLSSGLVTQGQEYSSGLGNVYIYSEQINNSTGDIVGSIYGAPNNPTLGTGSDALFQVSGSNGNGIAPYNPVEGGSGSSESAYDGQDGITDTITTASWPYSNSSYGNVLEVELGSNIAQGTSLAFLLQAGPFADDPSVNVYTADASTPQNVNTTSMSFDTTTTKSITDSSSVPQFTITKNTSGIEFVAIEADCHYLLLDSITGTPGTATPEPRFYGLLLVGLLGVAGTLYQRRRTAQANA